MRNYFIWFTTRICPDGQQEIHIRPATATNPVDIVFLDKHESALLTAILNRLANDQAIDWTLPRQDVLTAFYETATSAKRLT